MKPRRRPKGFRDGHTGTLACPHRDVSCCAECAAAHEEIVNVAGAHFWVPTAIERAELRAEMARFDAQLEGQFEDEGSSPAHERSNR